MLGFPQLALAEASAGTMQLALAEASAGPMDEVANPHQGPRHFAVGVISVPGTHPEKFRCRI